MIFFIYYLDEAEFLGDCVAVVAVGRLCCCGFLFFLRRYFGFGYYLILVKGFSFLVISKKVRVGLIFDFLRLCLVLMVMVVGVFRFVG